MTLKNLGSLVSGYLDPEGRNWETAVYQSGKPVLDKELNLSTDLANDRTRITKVRSLPSGWLNQDAVDSSEAVSAIFTDSIVSNEFRTPQDLIAHVNGWTIRVSNTNANDSNRLDLGASPTGAGARRTDLVILEVWRRLIEVAPSTDGKSPAGRIWWRGNVKVASADDLTLNYDDDLQDATLGSESTKRVQVQYRLRVIQGIDIFAYPYGMNDSGVVAHTVPASALAPDGVSTAFAYTNQSANGDPGLWLAGDGIPTNGLGTVDGYMYAIPLCAVFRRNDVAFDRNSNHNGGVAYGGSSDRPDSLFYDIVASRDVFDLRSTVSPTGWNYQELLEKNFNFLCDNSLRTEVGSSLIGGTSDGCAMLTAVEIGLSNSNGGDGVVTGDTPGADFIGEFDGVRREFSDAPVMEVVWLRYTPSDLGLGATWPTTDTTVTINTSNLRVYKHPTLDWGAHAPSNSSIMEVLTVWFEGETNGALTDFSRESVVRNVGVVPAASFDLRLNMSGSGATTQVLFLQVVIMYPPGRGTTRSPTVDYGSAGVEVNNPVSLPTDYGSDYTTVLDLAHRAVRYEYLTSAVDLETVYNSNLVNVIQGLTSGEDLYLYDRVESVNSITLNSAPYVGTVSIVPGWDNHVIKLDPGTLSNQDEVVVNCQVYRPMQQSGVQLTFYHEAVVPQTGRSSLIGTSLRVIPRYVSPYLYVMTSGPGSEGEAYPFPSQTAQTGGVYPSSSASYGGDHELRTGPTIALKDFSADTGFARVLANVPMVSNPQSLTLERVGGDVDVEGRSYFKSVPVGYAPAAMGQSLDYPVPHRVIQPMIAELAEDSIFGPRGMLILVTIQRWAPADKENRVGFDSTLATNTTSASVYRIKGNLLNGRAS